MCLEEISWVEIIIHFSINDRYIILFIFFRKGNTCHNNGNFFFDNIVYDCYHICSFQQPYYCKEVGYDLFLVVCSTVVFRDENIETQYNLLPFWTYSPMLEGNIVFIKESLMNLLLGFPIGVLVSVIINKKQWWKVLLFGLFISFSIEVLQFVYKRGCSEFDDMFHNTVGCLMGYGAYCVVARYVRKNKVIGRCE